VARALLAVRVQPRASRDEILGWQGEALRVRVTATPADGLANQAVAALLATAVGVPPSSIVLVGGARSREKLFRVGNLSLADLRGRLARPGRSARSVRSPAGDRGGSPGHPPPRGGRR
jgi:uncharacterized protein